MHKAACLWLTKPSYWRKAAVLACALALTACQKTSANADNIPTAQGWGALTFEPCSLPAVFGQSSVQARCSTLQVPENPAAPDGRQIDLHIAWVLSEQPESASTDPVFFLAGGPGQSAVETYPQLAHAFSEVLRSRHVILVDQRGTGKSNLLACEVDANGLDESPAAMAQIAQQCRRTLEQKADLRFYTTTDAVHDLDRVRQALGVQQINVMGVSYGTRVAQQYALRYPQHTRAVVLDSVLPNTLTMGNFWAKNLDDALVKQFALCQQAQACAQTLGQTREQLDAVLASLEAKPRQVQYRDAQTNQLQHATLTRAQFAGLVRMFAYSPQTASMLPHLIHEASQERFDVVMSLSQMVGAQVQQNMAMGMQFSVVCSEDGAGLQAQPSDANTVLGSIITDGLQQACAHWPRGEVPADFNQPLQGTLPVLAISGQLDPVTPPRYGDEAIAQLSQARHLVLMGQGHNVIGAGCMPKLFAQFLQTVDAQNLDASCLGQLIDTPPFIDFNGWSP